MLPEVAVQICDKVVLVAVLYNSYEVVIKKPNIQELLSLLLKHGPQWNIQNNNLSINQLLDTW